MSIPTKLETLLDLYDEGNLPPDEIGDMCQFLIDLGLNETLTQYTQLCEYCILEGICYDVVVGDTM